MRMSVFHWFHPVGQGLFSAGRLAIGPRDFDFQWVYDCGTTSTQCLVQKAINRFDGRRHRRKLDLVTISHFHKDHISGIVDLLKKVGTHDLMLPWAPLWHRLALGYLHGLTPDDPDFEFYIDPAKYLDNRAGDGFERIVFVPFSDGDGPPERDADPERDFDSEGEPRLKIEPEGSRDHKADDTLADWENYRDETQFGGERCLMPKDSAATFQGLWEFVPYNDPSTKPRDLESFSTRVNELRDKLLSANDNDREAALQELKKFYCSLKPKPKPNDLSLFLYGGPRGRRGSEMCYSRYGFRYGPRIPCNGSVIYTGDGNLSSEDKWCKLSGYLGKTRSNKPSVFQVPHHGSKNNWFPGLAKRIAPTVSVFSSDPSRYGHPHREVCCDFRPYRPIHVDTSNGFFTRIKLRPRGRMTP